MNTKTQLFQELLFLNVDYFHVKFNWQLKIYLDLIFIFLGIENREKS